MWLRVSALAIAGAVAAVTAVSVQAPAQQLADRSVEVNPPNRPNVLVIETDDMRADDLRFMPQTRKWIADRGLRFENSFAPNPLCCPSRTSFLTAKYSHNHHVLSHIAPYGFGAFDDSSTLATHLQGAGYQTALVGKYLNGYGSQPVHSTGDSSLTYVPPGWDQWAAGSDYAAFPTGSPLQGSTYNYWSMTMNVNGTLVSNKGRYSTDVTASKTRQIIDRFEAASRPWFVWWTPVAPHFGRPVEADDPKPVVGADGRTYSFETPARPKWVRGKFNKVIKHGIGLPAKGSPEADISDKPEFFQLPELTPAERRAELKSSRQRAETLYVLDRQIGKILAKLKATGALARTYVVFTSDNGYFLGEHRRRDGKIFSHEPSLRVPLLIAGPDVPVGRRYDPVMTIDLPETISDWTGAGSMAGCDGISLRQIINADQGWSRVMVTEGLETSVANPIDLATFASGLNILGLRTAGWSYIRYGDGEGEMYDLRTDPMQLDNLYADPAYADIRGQLQDLWTQYQNCHGDSCRTPVPPAFAATPEQERIWTQQQLASTHEYYK